MAMMSSNLYLPTEVLNASNYPEVRYLVTSINSLLAYAMRVQSALDDYNNGVYDKIDIDIVDLQSNINLCQSVCSTLGNAPNVCYDILLELRAIQALMQTLMYTKNRYGSQYVGTPTASTSLDPNIVG